MSVKVQINSKAALERLLGNEEEMEVEVKRSVIASFADGFVKNIHNVEAIKQTINRMIDNIQTETALQIKEALKLEGIEKKRSGWDWKIELSSEITAKIHSEVTNMIFDQVNTAVNGLDIEGIIQGKVEQRVDYAVRKEMRKIVEDKVLEAVQVALNNAGVVE